jgi:Ran GTPase-activating protein (RanGAP) involved in mRNA processing and transport
MITTSRYSLLQTPHVCLSNFWFHAKHREIVESLQANTSLTSLNLRSFSVLDLNQEEKESVIQLFQACTSLRKLDLSRLRADTISTVNSGLALLTNLEELNLSDYNELRGTSGALSTFFPTISKLTALTVLDISKNRGIYLDHLLWDPIALPNLRKLDISINPTISQAAFSSLCGLIKNRTSLTDLNHGYTDIPTGQLNELSDALQTSPALQRLNLQNADLVTNQDFGRFAHALAVNTVLTSLNLSRTEANIASLTTSLLHNTTITELDLSHCQINHEEFPCLIDLIKGTSTLQALRLFGWKLNPEYIEGMSQAIAVNSSLTKLKLELDRLTINDTSKFTSWTDTNTTLTALVLKLSNDGEGVTEGMFNAAIRSTTLANLMIYSGSDVVQDPVGMLQTALLTPSLRKLHIQTSLKTESIDFEPIVGYFHQNTTLESLILCGNNYSTEQLKSFKRALSSNQSITKVSIWDLGSEMTCEILFEKTTNRINQFKGIVNRNKQNALMRRVTLLEMLWKHLMPIH